MAISMDDRVKQSREPVTADVDGEVVMASMERGSYYGLDKVGSRIWELITEPMTVNELCDRLQREYQVDRETCQNDVIEFVEQMLEEKLIEVER